MNKKILVISIIFIIIISILYFLFENKDIKKEIDFKTGSLNPDNQNIITNIPPQNDE